VAGVVQEAAEDNWGSGRGLGEGIEGGT
jgi:hypothetical protein